MSGEPAAPTGATRSTRSARAPALLGILLLTLFVLLLVWLALLGLEAVRIASSAHSLQRRLDATRADLQQQSSGQGSADRIAADLSALQAQSRQLRSRTHAGLWRTGTAVPGLSSSVRETDRLADVAGDVADQVLPAYVQLARVAPGLRASDGDVDVAALQQQVAPVVAATDRLDALTTSAHAIPAGGIRPLDRGRTQLLDGLAQLQGYGRSAAETLQVAPTLLGAQGPRTVLVVLESPAESRAGGGLVGGYVLLRTDHGHVTVASSGTNHDLADTAAPVTSIGPQYDALYGPLGALRSWPRSTFSPDFPKTATLWAALFQKQYGIEPDAEIGITPTVLDDVLATTGPVTLPGGQRLASGQANQLLQVGLYQRYPTFADEPQRSAYQLAVLRTTVDAAIRSGGDPSTLLRRLGAGVDDGDLRVHVTDPTAQQEMASAPVAGALSSAPGPFFGAYTDSSDGTKLSAYLAETVTYRRGAVQGGHQTTSVTASFVNRAPSSGLPAYADTRFLPAGTADPGPGSHQFLIALYLATDATDPVVTFDGKPTTPVLVAREQNHLVAWVMPPPLVSGGQETVTLTASEPASDRPPTTLRQPSLIPTVYDVSGSASRS